MTSETLPKRIKSIVDKHPQEDCAHWKKEDGSFELVTFSMLWNDVRTLGSGLLSLGIKREEHVGIMSDNMYRWLVTDLALLSIGAADIPRGSDSTADEMAYILNHADCKITFAENKSQLEKILSKKKEISSLKKIIILDPAYPKDETGKQSGIDVHSFDEIMEAGKKELEKHPDRFEKELEAGDIDDLASILYTSGTTGEPKGVMLTHRNFLFQMDRIDKHLHLYPTDIFLSVLPIWHSFERAVEYVCLNLAVAIAYSKPIGKIMLDDFKKIRPTWMTAVPRLWEGIRAGIIRNVNSQGGIKKIMFHFFLKIGQVYASLGNMIGGRSPQFRKRLRAFDITIAILPFILLTPFKALGNVLVFKKLKALMGGRFVAGVSGGGALPAYVDKFFQAAGIPLLEGYGLTETAPILSVRYQHHPVSGTVGPLLQDVEYRLLDEEGKELPPGKMGTLYVKSPQVMQGYYKKPEETAKVLIDGWLNTGDLAVFTHTGEFTIVGRSKDTIVLLGGENIEPNPIEENLVQSDFIDQAMVVGQDQKFLGALIVINQEKVEEYAKRKNIQFIDSEELQSNPEIKDLIYDEIQSLVNPKRGFKPFERIFRFTILPKAFEVGDEMTRSLKIRRNVVNERYKKEIAGLFK